jgi:pimeloyl-ACP methyl ester carboxylesterase
MAAGVRCSTTGPAGPAAQRAKFGSVPRNRVVEFPNHGHYFFQVEPQESRRIIREWVRSLP